MYIQNPIPSAWPCQVTDHLKAFNDFAWPLMPSVHHVADSGLTDGGVMEYSRYAPLTGLIPPVRSAQPHVTLTDGSHPVSRLDLNMIRPCVTNGTRHGRWV